jgi:hypothetical protein
MYILLLLFLFVVAAVLVAYGLSHLKPNKMPDKANVLQTSEQQNEPAHQEQPSSRQQIDTPQVQRLQYFCIKDKGYHVSVWPKDQGFSGIDYINFNIAGITHGEHIDDHLGEFVATLEPDPANPYDANAIKILTSNGDRVGYVPNDITSNVRAFTQLPCKCYCYIWKNNEIYYSCCYISKDEC